MAKKTDKDAKADGKKKDKKDKKGKGKAGDEQAPGSSIATHPRARSSVRRAKGWAGLAGFAIAAALSLQASVPMFDVGVRALAAGVVGYMLAWWCSVLIWRQLIVAEQHAAVEEIERRRADSSDPRSAEAQPTGG
jgi:hypothetical protein